MKKFIIAIIMMSAAGTVMADADDYGYGYGNNYAYRQPGYGYGYRNPGYGYDQVDNMANYQQAQINTREQMAVAHEMREGDYREADQAIRQAEAMKYQVRQNQAAYDQMRDMGGYGYRY